MDPCIELGAGPRGRGGGEGHAAVPQRAGRPTARRPPAGGVRELSDAELVARIAGVAELDAARALAALGGLHVLAEVGHEAIAVLGSLHRPGALRVAAAAELARRLVLVSARPRVPVRSPGEVAALMLPRLRGLVHEEVWVVSLDGRSSVRGLRRVAQGGHHGCAVAAREILRAALLDAASAFVLVHNHPSGDPEPSPEDVEMTRLCGLGAAAAGVPLVDHVILASSGEFRSLVESGHMPPG
ncbi:MAG: JAB domain-containing protein [Polyangiaceae bacterium]|nr:JAB domain-containing protein [Polyangiaceae bacterium]